MTPRSAISCDKLAKGFQVIAAARRRAIQTTTPRADDIPVVRAGVARHLAGFALPPSGSKITYGIESSRFPITRIVPMQLAARPPIVFIHGGGFVFHDIQTFLPLLDRIAAVTGRLILAIDYPKAPETAPGCLVAGLLKAISSIVTEISKNGPAPLLVGDSIGGLVVLVCAHERLNRLEVPLVLLQPLLSLDVSKCVTRTTEPDGREFLDAAHLRWFIRLACETTLDDIKPLDFDYVDFNRMGSVTIVSPTCDLLLADAQSFVMRASRFGFNYRHVLLPGLPHDFALYAGRVHEAREGISQLLDILM